MIVETSALGAESGWIIHLLKSYVDDMTAICETIKKSVRWTMPSPKVANKSDVFGSVDSGGPPGKPTTMGSQGRQPNAAKMPNVCGYDVFGSPPNSCFSMLIYKYVKNSKYTDSLVCKKK